MEEFPIFEWDQPIGDVKVTKEGLYYHFSCICQLSSNSIQRLYAKTENGCIEIGVLVPMKDGGYGIERRLPGNRISGKIKTFFIGASMRVDDASFYPLDPTTPFAAVAMLKTAIFCVRNATPGLIVQFGVVSSTPS